MIGSPNKPIEFNVVKSVEIDLSTILSISLNRFSAKTIDGGFNPMFSYKDVNEELQEYIRENVEPNCNWDKETRKICYGD